MAHRKEIVRKTDKRIPLDASIDGSDGSRTVADMLAAPESSPDELDEDWRRAVLESARERVLMRTALSDRDRQVYRDYAIEGMDIADVARKYSLSRNHVSQIKPVLKGALLPSAENCCRTAACENARTARKGEQQR
jgi:DNA-directed RNA polymerase specialized sigma subunit